ncbi:MAG: DUF4386 domain-containing protein [Acidobacteriales bacterium]|nr:DUF4386 domain-containing protein [Terriglobales bacterium]
MTDRAIETSPQTYARMAGVLYLMLIIAGSFGEIGVQGAIVVRNDPAATARNILAHELLYRWGMVTSIITVACHLSLAIVLYNLFKRVNKDVSLLMAGFILLACSVDTVNVVNDFAALNILQGHIYASAFNTEQLQALAYTSLRMRAVGHTLGILFVGLYLTLLGYLIFSSVLVPRILGALLAIGGLGQIILSFARFVAPNFAVYLFPSIVAPAGIAMIWLTLWLLLKGVDSERWKQHANARTAWH